ncbi:M3 family metallopeptidase [Nocardia sp. XZ_19_385]|uniref:M3 family metallopeptidase n=1 Tax=Nocardia sp. XZ_19_385 TaxID=2769488 RepID=UPI002815CBD6|nr:M3 family metallopeptidase [Nocardia sp. XZ_19_385]
MTSNPFFEPSMLPYQLPPFADIREEHYLPAFQRGMSEQLAEIEALTAGSDAPTFANTLAALERSGTMLTRVANVFFNVAGADSTPGTDAIEAEISPKLAAHRDAILLNPDLFARVEALHAKRHELGLEPEELRLLEERHTEFVRAGARLDPAGQARLRELNAELAAAGTEFGQNNLAAMNAATLLLDRAEELAGLAPAEIAAAAENAESLGHPGKWALSLQNVSNQPILAELADRDVRRRMMSASLGRGFGEQPNAALAVRITSLRAERAELLGYPDHAAYTVEDQTAKTTAAVEEMLGRLAPLAVANAEREQAQLTTAMHAADPEAGDLHSWDWQYWSEKVRSQQFSFDADALRPYLELERVLRDGVFYAAEQVYGITLHERKDLIGYHPEVRVFEVFDADGSELGLFLGDFFKRPSKRGGAWMNELVSQSGLFGTMAVVVNNLNIVKPSPGQPALLTWDNVRTLFHEFGHALHGLFSNVHYPSFSGTEVPRDFVEFPSQVNEIWMTRPEILPNYAKHVETGEPIPVELIERMAAAEQFGEGFRTVEYLGAALLDWAWHRISAPVETGAEAFEAEALRKAGVALAAIPPRYRTGYFAHIFSGIGYSAGYYSYIWSEVLDADTVDWFEDGAASIREKGETFRQALLSRGGAVDPMAAFESFRGRAPDIRPLLKRRGLLTGQ